MNGKIIISIVILILITIIVLSIVIPKSKKSSTPEPIPDPSCPSNWELCLTQPKGLKLQSSQETSEDCKQACLENDCSVYHFDSSCYIQDGDLSWSNNTDYQGICCFNPDDSQPPPEEPEEIELGDYITCHNDCDNLVDDENVCEQIASEIGVKYNKTHDQGKCYYYCSGSGVQKQNCISDALNNIFSTGEIYFKNDFQNKEGQVGFYRKSWEVDEWGDCNKDDEENLSCIQTRNVYCPTGRICDESNKPSSTKSCVSNDPTLGTCTIEAQDLKRCFVYPFCNSEDWVNDHIFTISNDNPGRFAGVAGNNSTTFNFPKLDFNWKGSDDRLKVVCSPGCPEGARSQNGSCILSEYTWYHVARQQGDYFEAHPATIEKGEDSPYYGNNQSRGNSYDRQRENGITMSQEQWIPVPTSLSRIFERAAGWMYMGVNYDACNYCNGINNQDDTGSTRMICSYEDAEDGKCSNPQPVCNSPMETCSRYEENIGPYYVRGTSTKDDPTDMTSLKTCPSMSYNIRQCCHFVMMSWAWLYKGGYCGVMGINSYLIENKDWRPGDCMIYGGFFGTNTRVDGKPSHVGIIVAEEGSKWVVWQLGGGGSSSQASHDSMNIGMENKSNCAVLRRKNIIDDEGNLVEDAYMRGEKTPTTDFKGEYEEDDWVDNEGTKLIPLHNGDPQFPNHSSTGKSMTNSQADILEEVAQQTERKLEKGTCKSTTQSPQCSGSNTPEYNWNYY